MQRGNRIKLNPYDDSITNAPELRKPNGDYTEEGLRYLGMKADIDLCYRQLYETCKDECKE